MSIYLCWRKIWAKNYTQYEILCILFFKLMIGTNDLFNFLIFMLIHDLESLKYLCLMMKYRDFDQITPNLIRTTPDLTKTIPDLMRTTLNLVSSTLNLN